MNFDSVNANKPVGEIVYLAGPSSSGKTTSTKGPEFAGWMRIEADIERPYVRIQQLKETLLDDLSYLESHLEDPSPMNTIEAIHGNPPDKPQANADRYQKARQNLAEHMEKMWDKTQDCLQLHMLDKALSIAEAGKSVIIDDVPMVNPGYGSHKISIDKESPNLWCYRDFKIEQKLKFVPVDILMRNVLRRNSGPDPEERRPMPMVLAQYSDCFMAATSGKQEQLGTLDVAHLKKWIEHSCTIDFFDFSPNHKFEYDGKKDIDVAVKERMTGFLLEMEDPDNAVDPKGQKVEGEVLDALKEKKQAYPNLPETIKKATSEILQKMGIADDATTVTLTYRSSSDIKPAIMRDL